MRGLRAHVHDSRKDALLSKRVRAMADMREQLRHIYSHIYVECVVNNPLCQARPPT